MIGSRPAFKIGAAAFTAALVYTGAALAEVCDKVAPDWNPDLGPATVGSEVFQLVVSPVYISILGLAGLAIAIARSFLAYFVGTGCVLFAIAIFLADGLENEIIQAAAREGCITGQPVMETAYAVTGLLALAAGLIARNRRMRNSS
ncbi:hypothetical protein [Mesorhizobium sp. CN2-181]|uniref:hypothetical protein n=1 Tax=Mesorhizobium yinganensis TaxID=3157707 RepID=UPI0032B706C6